MKKVFARQINRLCSKLHRMEQMNSLRRHGGLELELYTPKREVNLDRFFLVRVFNS